MSEAEKSTASLPVDKTSAEALAELDRQAHRLSQRSKRLFHHSALREDAALTHSAREKVLAGLEVLLKDLTLLDKVLRVRRKFERRIDRKDVIASALETAHRSALMETASHSEEETDFEAYFQSTVRQLDRCIEVADQIDGKLNQLQESTEGASHMYRRSVGVSVA